MTLFTSNSEALNSTQAPLSGLFVVDAVCAFFPRPAPLSDDSPRCSCWTPRCTSCPRTTDSRACWPCSWRSRRTGHTARLSCLQEEAETRQLTLWITCWWWNCSWRSGPTYRHFHSSLQPLNSYFFKYNRRWLAFKGTNKITKLKGLKQSCVPDFSFLVL